MCSFCPAQEDLIKVTPDDALGDALMRLLGTYQL
jgi:hypothetical protein